MLSQYLFLPRVAKVAGIALVLCLSMTTPAFATEQQGGASEAQNAPANAQNPNQRSAEMEWQRLYEQWQALPQKQKDRMYKAREAVDKADCNFIDQAVESKLLDPEIGKKMKEHIKARTERIKEEGDIPMFRRGLGKPPNHNDKQNEKATDKAS